eukprot:403343375
MGNQVRKNKSKHYQGHSQLFHNQYVINEFYQHLPQLLSLLFPIQDGIFFDNKFIYFIDGWFTDYKQCMLELMIKKQGILQTIWSEVLDLSSRINNIYETQLPTVCLEYYNLTRGTTNKNPSLKFKIEEVLPYHSQLIIKTNDTQILPAFYHNLTTQPEIQRNALQTYQREYTQPLFNGFLTMKYNNKWMSDNKIRETLLDESRLDISRMNIINFTKILSALLDERYKLVYEQNAMSFQPSDQFILAFEEYVLNPQIFHYTNQSQNLHSTQRFKQTEFELFSTQHLEGLYVLIQNLQRPHYLFNLNLTHSHLPINQFITESQTNYLVELKGSLYRYFKALFNQAYQNNYNPQTIQSNERVTGKSFRANSVSDVAKVWLQLLQPWNNFNSFIDACLRLNNPSDESQDQQCLLFDKKKALNFELFGLLSHTSITSLNEISKAWFIEDLGERASYRNLYEQYVSEMSVFYFDILVDYLGAIIKQGLYTVEDLIVFNDVLQLFGFQQETQVQNRGEDAEMLSVQSGGSRLQKNPSKLYTIDGFINSDMFIQLARSYYGQTEFREFYQGDKTANGQVKAFVEDNFWGLLSKAQSKLHSFDYSSTLNPLGLSGRGQTSQHALLEVEEIKRDSAFKVDELRITCLETLQMEKLLNATVADQSIYGGSFIGGRQSTYMRSQTAFKKTYVNDEEEYKRSLRSNFIHGSALKQNARNPLMNRTHAPKLNQKLAFNIENNKESLDDDAEQIDTYVNKDRNNSQQPEFNRKFTMQNAFSYREKQGVMSQSVSKSRMFQGAQDPRNRYDIIDRNLDQASLQGADQDQVETRQIGRGTQSRGRSGQQKLQTLRKTKNDISRLEKSLYIGNQWDKQLGSNEYRIVNYFMKLIAFLCDRIRGIKHPQGRWDVQPVTQWPKNYVPIENFIFFIIGIVIGYYGLVYLIFG